MNTWRVAALCWISVIFFSSTSVAGTWAELAFTSLSSIFISGVQPKSASYDVLHVLADKGFHVAMFCILALLLWKALGPVPRKAPLIVFMGAVIGSCSEYLQTFFPDRDPAIRDVLINIGGTALGLVIIQLSSRFPRDAISKQHTSSAEVLK